MNFTVRLTNDINSFECLGPGLVIVMFKYCHDLYTRQSPFYRKLKISEGRCNVLMCPFYVELTIFTHIAVFVCFLFEVQVDVDRSVLAKLISNYNEGFEVILIF